MPKAKSWLGVLLILLTACGQPAAPTLVPTPEPLATIVPPPTTAAPAPTAVPPATTVAAPACMPTPQRIPSPPMNGNEHIQGGAVSPGCSRSFVVRVSAGQNLGVAYGGYNVFTGNVTVQDPNGNPLSGSGAAGTTYYHASSTGDYTITFDGSGQATFDVSVRP